MPVTDEHFNYVMNVKQQYANKIFSELQLLAQCFPFVPDDLKGMIEKTFEEFCVSEGAKVYWERTGDKVVIRRIQ